MRFVIGMRGLETSVDTVMTEDQFWANDDLPPNMQWEHVEVESEEDKNKYVAARERYLEAAWTPNQSAEDRKDNAVIMREAEAEMERLRK